MLVERFFFQVVLSSFTSHRLVAFLFAELVIVYGQVVGILAELSAAFISTSDLIGPHFLLVEEHIVRSALGGS